MKQLTIITTFIIFTVFPVFAYDNTFKNSKQIQNIIDSSCTIKTEIKYTIYEVENTDKIEAVAVYIGNNYFLALTHATSTKDSIEINIGFGPFKVPVSNISYQYYINNTEANLIGKYDDLSLFKAKYHTEKPVVYFSDSSTLKIGDIVIMIGNSHMNGVNIKPGIVSLMSLSREKWGPDYYSSFVISNTTNPGDSGSMLLARKNGKYYIVGIVHSYFEGQGIGLAFRSNYVIGALKFIMGECSWKQ